VNLKCPKCNKWFELGPKCAREDKFNISGYITCSKCGSITSASEVVGEARWGEFCNWVINFNLKVGSGKPTELSKAIWRVMIHDHSLRMVMEAEGAFGNDSPMDPTLVFTTRSAAEPDKTFILAKFNEFLNKTYQRGFIDPVIRIQFITTAEEGKYYDL
jgi:hypothetical protein